MSFEFLITSLVVVLLPGTGVLYTMTIGLARGFRASVAAAFGCTLGILPAAIASIIGLAAIFHTSAVAFQVIKYLGAAYLLYMAWSILREGGAMDINSDEKQRSHFKTAMHGAMINALNPKLSLFFLAFLPQFIDAGSATATEAMMQLALVFMLMTFAVFVLYGAFSAYMRDFVISKPRVMKWLKASFAATFGYLSVKLALSER
ncbi:LysE family translocator [Lentilitoribacter sp. EG35]|jgi:threonine/homoserine/homoserine lactone efflux protein|uniref:LysE family translocator n=1 Tax=Lentilitoribacter sp. EG35 TaxID=3234192 RepID=UPI00345F926A